MPGAVDQSLVADELRDDRGRRRGEDARGRSQLEHPPLHENRNDVGEGARLADVLRGHERRDAEVMQQVAEQFAPERALQLAERRRRFVEQQQVRPRRDRARQCDTPARFRRQLGDLARGVFAKSDVQQQLVRLLEAALLGPAAGAHAERDVVARGLRLEEGEILEDEPDPSLMGRPIHHGDAVDQHLAAIERIEAGNRAQERGFACTGGPEERGDPAILDLERDAVERGGARAGAARERADGERGHVRTP